MFFSRPNNASVSEIAPESEIIRSVLGAVGVFGIMGFGLVGVGLMGVGLMGLVEDVAVEDPVLGGGLPVEDGDFSADSPADAGEVVVEFLGFEVGEFLFLEVFFYFFQCGCVVGVGVFHFIFFFIFFFIFHFIFFAFCLPKFVCFVCTVCIVCIVY